MKDIQKLSSHLSSLGYATEIIEHESKNGSTSLRMLEMGLSGSGEQLLGVVQLTGLNIGFINISRVYWEGEFGNKSTLRYYMGYIVPLKPTPSLWCQADLKKISRGLIRRKVIDIEWKADIVLVEPKGHTIDEWGGDTLVDLLNRDLYLKQALMKELNLNRKLDITVRPGEHAMIETTGISYGVPGYYELLLPSQNLIDCLDRIAGIIIENETESHSRLERLWLKADVKIKSSLKESETAECCVTDKQVLIKKKEPLLIPISRIDSCDTQIISPPKESYHGVPDYSTAMSVARLKYRNASGILQTVELEMSTWASGTLRSATL